MSAALLYVTAPDAKEAEMLARGLLDARLAACVNLLPMPTRSLYRWQGKPEESDECTFIVKTTAALAEKAQEFIRANHSYECPCILIIPVSGGNPEFLAWIEAETANAD